MSIRAGIALAFLFPLLLAGTASAQQETRADDIVVTGERVERLREMSLAYADSVAAPAGAADQYPRWNFRLCPSVAGLAPTDAQMLIDHIARRAHDVGVEAERTGCQRNLVIIFAPDGDTLAREIVDQRRDLLGYYSDDDVATAGRDALEDFANTPRAVRWWHVSRRTTADGQQLGDSRSRGGRSTAGAAAAAASDNPTDPTAALSGSGFEGIEGVRSRGSRMRRSTRQDLSFALLIVDTRRTAGLPPQAVADYLSMATLVQLNPRADLSSFPSILNLFANPQPVPTGMTEWDIAYLRGLYAATREAASAQAQRTDIARRMAEHVSQQ